MNMDISMKSSLLRRRDVTGMAASFSYFELGELL